MVATVFVFAGFFWSGRESTHGYRAFGSTGGVRYLAVIAAGVFVWLLTQRGTRTV